MAERQVGMAERQIDGRLALEKAQSRNVSLGLWGGILISLVGLVGGIYLVNSGYQWPGLIVIGVDFGWSFSSFFFTYRTNSRQSK